MNELSLNVILECIYQLDPQLLPFYHSPQLGKIFSLRQVVMKAEGNQKSKNLKEKKGKYFAHFPYFLDKRHYVLSRKKFLVNLMQVMASFALCSQIISDCFITFHSALETFLFKYNDPNVSSPKQKSNLGHFPRSNVEIRVC